MPTFRPGHLSAAAYGPLNASEWLNNTDWKTKIETADVSHYGSLAKEYIPGLAEGSLTLAGMFDANRTVGAQTFDLIAETMANSGADVPVTLFFDGGLAVGRRCALATAIQTKYAPSSPIGGAVTMNVEAICDGRPADGYCLIDGVPNGTTATTNYATVDNGATAGATTKGMTANIHIAASTRTGTITVKLQHSVDNSVWVDLVSQVVPATTVVGYIATSAGTVNRYVRGQVITLAGTGSITVIAAFARN